MREIPSQKTKDNLSIVLCGEAGQGIQTVEQTLTQVLKSSGYNIFSSNEYMSRIRGGSNSTSIRVSSKRVSAFRYRADIVIPLSKGAVNHVGNRISPETVILGEKEMFEAEYNGANSIDIPLSKMASEVGGRIYSNTIAVGLLSGLFEVEIDILDGYLKRRFSGKGESIVGRNIEAAKRGYKVGSGLLSSGKIAIEIPKDQSVRDDILLSGVEAVAMGAVAGGCNFVSFYPMSPATGVAAFLAQHAKDLDLIVEQAEDEIAAINMVIGAWYAGARGMASTSGGGFALMVEGISLAGMLETPLVVHIGQRPGPATGLPTRTEQADLLFALFAGHGEFPRVILAPGTVEDNFYLTQRAFSIADKYQVPVFLLTDQYLLDSSCNIPSLKLPDKEIEHCIVETDRGYQRYDLTESGISPRGIPGFGEGLVCVDSDEHDEEGHITEDLDLRTRMVDKRLRKISLFEQEMISPELIGSPDYRVLVIGWGSTRQTISEALKELGRDDVSFLHFNQVYPLPPETANYLNRANVKIIVENNATSQLNKLIKLCTGIDVEKKLLKYNGLPFSVEEIKDSLSSLI